ncbi:MAG: nitroreductase family protein [Lentisphaeria bacterium]|nr:nitroreductase family protein [Lentisphaeria bacterium]
MNKAIILLALILCGTLAAADIKLPPPVKEGGMTLRKSLAERRTRRAFSDKPLSKQMLSDLLWAANGISSKDGRRTAPTARNIQELELGVLLPEGAFLYDAQNNKLIRRSAEPNKGPITIAIIWDTGKQPKKEYAAVDSGFIGQNIYLFATANGLNSVFKATFNRKSVTEKLKLEKHRQVIYVHTVGFPK